MPEYSIGSPAFSVLEQMLVGSLVQGTSSLLSRHVRARQSSTGFGMEAPVEGNFSTAVHRVEDSKRHWYDRRAGSLGHGLLLDQVRPCWQWTVPRLRSHTKN